MRGIFGKKQEIITIDNVGLYTVEPYVARSIRRKEKGLTDLRSGISFLIVGLIFLVWGCISLNALDNVVFVSGALRQYSYEDDSDCIVLTVDEQDYVIAFIRTAELSELNSRLTDDIQIGDSVEISAFEELGGRKRILGLKCNDVEYMNAEAMQAEYTTDAKQRLYLGAMLFVIGFALGIHSAIKKRDEQK